ncbi:ethanolamine utilization protein EutH [Mycolicibacterium sp. BiH015]|uniref:ethanolamine utilization protein EutH n=1 Tax=Mycolicibacterium sp. BiH015 TaxID=3018808 RepID=UPI0022E8704B|nr:ethanolamine utilization protein EutH [Mycolicibacterium sp. BiH015]MDA2893332.1 ethanolamine utilization protein EutH [Mycolicibacterium sp. BiH015]
MEIIGQAVIYIMMAFLLIGAVCFLRDDSEGFGKEFKEGIYSIGPIFLPVAGIMVYLPVLTEAITRYMGPVYGWLHSDPSLAATTILPGDMGGYQLAFDTAGSHSAWILAFAASLTAGTLVCFTIPVGLAMLRRQDHKFLALGVMAGVLATPIAVFVITLTLQLSQTPLRPDISTTSAPDTPLSLSAGEIAVNLIPLIVFAVVLAVLLRFFTSTMVRVFIGFGRILQGFITLGLALSIVQYFTGVFDHLGTWPLAPFIADAEDQFRALEIAGYVGIMLAGAFPMVYAIRTWLTKPLTVVGKRFGFSEEGAAGLLAGSANILALFRVIALMPARDKVVTIAYAVCAGFTFGDHLAFTANFQPSIVAPVIIGKLIGGVFGILFALWLAVPYARRLEQLDLIDKADSPDQRKQHSSNEIS